MSLGDEFRVVPETCLTMSSGLNVRSDYPLGQGMIIGSEEVEQDILANTRSGPFENLEAARESATAMLEENPEYSLMIVKGLVGVEHLWNQDYWFNKDVGDAKKQTSKLFVIGLIISAAILISFTSPLWALGTIVISIVLSVLFWEPHLVPQVLAPTIIAIISTLLYSFLQ